jgi:hypothetical protein
VARGERASGWLALPGTAVRLPLAAICGARPGPTLLVTSLAVAPGDPLVGIGA